MATTTATATATMLSATTVQGMSPLMFSLQALLVRHETYITDSENERKRMTAQIEMLEAEKSTLERKNALAIQENRNLLDQLEAVNTALTDSDAQVTSLQATLLTTQQELSKLSQLATRTERLEQQLADFERDQVTWQLSVEHKEEAERSAIRRWQQAERTLASLQEQIERIERESREERERHVEVVGRMERRHAVERELNSAAGRLKGAAAARTSSREAGGTNVVSHFVKDILQDNANLQLGIVELREMLSNSNDEVEKLRTQLLEHQPTAEEVDDNASQATATRKDLRDELNRATSQEVHVHHHYHAPANNTKTPTIRRSRSKKKRYGALTPGHFTPPTGLSTPRSSISFGTPSSSAAIFGQTAVSIPSGSSQRFVDHSRHNSYSMLSSPPPSSPLSTNRTSSIFDRVFSDVGQDSSRPTTPDTEDPGSPESVPFTSKRASGGSFKTYSTPIPYRSASEGTPSLSSILDSSVDDLPSHFTQGLDHTAIPEENENEWENSTSPGIEEGSNMASPYTDDMLDLLQRPSIHQKFPLRRAASHESLLSISGMDIHTLQSRPSQLLAPTARRSITSNAVLSDAHATATRPAAISRTSDRSRSLLSGMAADQRQAGRPSLGQKVGGWVFGKWGATPTVTSPSSPLSPSQDVPQTVVKPSSKVPEGNKRSASNQSIPKVPKHRTPGINQAGPILGFFPEVKQQHLPIVNTLDEEALRMALGD